jgi:Flp pilus assembly pilin Flp
MSPGRWGRGESLRNKRARADKRCMRLLSRHARASRDERGQALVEFALIAPLFLMLVIGVIQFAVALNFWFDLQRIANQGARSAAVNCGPATLNQCTSATATTLQAFLAEQVISGGNTPTVEICYVPPTSDYSVPPPDPISGNPWQPSAGTSIRVTLKDRYRLQAVVNLAKIDLTARATMRLEQDPKSPALPDPTNSANWVLNTHTGAAACQP